MHPSLWVRWAAPLPPERQPLPAAADVVVLGAGIAGVSAALWLARLGISPVVLEAGQVAGRASGRNDGQMLLGLGEHYNRVVGQFGADRARVLWDFIRRNNDALKAEITALELDCDLRQGGGLRLAESEHEAAELAEAAAQMAAEGFEHELLDAAALRDALPVAEGFHGALRLPGEAVVQPAALVSGLAVAARAAGAAIHEQTPVTAIESAAAGHTITTANGERVRAQVVVHCTSTLARQLDPTGFLGAQVFPFRGQILASEPLPEATARRFPDAAMSSHFCYEYFRLHGRRFVVGGMRWSVPGEQLGLTDDSGHDEAVANNLRAWVDRHFPCLRGVDFPHSWTGIMAGTSDGLPLCGPLPGSPGRFALLGFNGYGLSFAFEAGRALAALVVDGRAIHPVAPMLAPRRFA